MYNDVVQKTIINDLEGKKLKLVETALALASQGFIVNQVKYVKLGWSSILIDAFQNMNLFSDEQQRKIEQIYNKVSEL